MSNEVLFTEKQSFRQWWIWLLILGSNALIIYTIASQVFAGQLIGDKPISSLEMIMTGAATTILTILFFTLRLETQIKSDGVYVRFFPFHLKFRHYSANTISNMQVRQYQPIREYGGWGFRGRRNNRALNVSGNMGLQIEFTDKSRLLIGTRKPEELEIAIRKISMRQ